MIAACTYNRDLFASEYNEKNSTLAGLETYSGARALEWTGKYFYSAALLGVNGCS